jgi:hypothetical protein
MARRADCTFSIGPLGQGDSLTVTTTASRLFALVKQKNAVLALAATFACTLSAAPASAAPILDPAGDTFYIDTLDLTSIHALADGVTVTFSLMFAGPIAAPSTFVSNSVFGFVDVDTDQNAATGGSAPWGGPVVGGNSWINFYIPSIPGPTIGLGDEFYLDLASELFHPGSIDVVATASNSTVGAAPVSYVGNLMTIFVPQLLFGGDPSFNYGVLIGDFLGPTDRAPNGDSPAASEVVPEPSTIALFGLGWTAAYRARRRRLV